MSNTSVTADKCGSQSESSVQPKEVYSFENDPLPKVRKPYTITKQREKWTEEEHQRFLEALKLYGRGWRRIEEHVGTKTAVQIRSHAQKFFSKVVRESNGVSESFIKPIEIPPPRPKRKPMHPYPRKTVDLLKGTPVSNQPERLPSSNALVLDKDNQSPTSVLSAFASDTSDQQNGCSSPASCTTEMQSANLSPVEKENEYATSNTSPEEEKVPMLSAGSNVENSLSVKIEPESKDSVCIKGAAAVVPPYTSIRLLGQTISVTVSQKPCLQDAENHRSPISKTGQENLVIDNANFVHTVPSEQSDAHLSFGMVASNCNHPFQSGSPCLEPEKDSTNIAEVNPPNACQPSWPLYQPFPFINFIPYNQSSGPTLRESSVQEGLKEKEVLNERSCAGSSTGSVSELENREKNSDAAVDSQYRQPCSSAQNSPSKSTKGFVPYKRCLPEGDVKSQIIASEERERQRARVCS